MWALPDPPREGYFVMAGSFKGPIAILLVVLALIGIAAAWKYLSGRAESKWLVLSGTIEAEKQPQMNTDKHR